MSCGFRQNRAVFLRSIFCKAFGVLRIPAEQGVFLRSIFVNECGVLRIPAEPWEETVPDITARLKGIVQEINDTLDVDGLCRALPKRLQALVDAEGDRISY